MVKRLGLLVVILMMAGNASAAVGFSDFLLTFTGAYVSAEFEETGDMIDGAAIVMTFEQVGHQDPVSFGISFAYMGVETEVNESGLVNKQEVTSFPLYIVGKYWLGKGTLQGYFGGAFGVYFSRLKTTFINDKTDTSETTMGTGLSVPLGFIVNLSDSAFINFNYSFNWLIDNQYLKNGMIHAIGAGIGFNFGY